MREKLLGYPRNLSVYEVTSCPQNESSWKASAQRLGCNLEIVEPFTDFYYCIPTKSTSRLVEFCYDRSSKGQGEDRCLVLDDNGMHASFDCSHFTQGCPDTHYLPENIYQYPACLNINTEKSCYLAEKGCSPHTSSTVMDSTSEYISTNPDTSSPVTYISNAFWSSTTFEGLSTSSVTPEHPHFEVFVVFAVAVILCFIVAIMQMRRKKESIAGDDDEKTELMEPRDLPKQISVEIDGPSSIVFGKDVVLQGRIVNMGVGKGMVIVAWFKGDISCDTEIDITVDKYKGSSTDFNKPILCINSAEFSDRGFYQLKVNDFCSVAKQLDVTGRSCLVVAGTSVTTLA